MAFRHIDNFVRSVLAEAHQWFAAAIHRVQRGASTAVWRGHMYGQQLANWDALPFGGIRDARPDEIAQGCVISVLQIATAAFAFTASRVGFCARSGKRRSALDAAPIQPLHSRREQ